MPKKPSISFDNHLNQIDSEKTEEINTKLQALKIRLEAGENSPIINDFNGEEFIITMHQKYISSAKL